MTTTTPQNFADHSEIEKVINLYASAIDTQSWDTLKQVFTEDAVADFVGIGLCEGRQSITDLIHGVLIKCAATQHLLGNIDIDVNGDHARTSCYLQAMHAGLGKYEGEIFTVWGKYDDELIRTDHGWRIKHRTLTTTFASGDIGFSD